MIKLFNKLFSNRNNNERGQNRAIALKPNLYQSLFERLALEVNERYLTEDECNKILNYPIVESAINSRKAATAKKEIILTCENKTVVDEFYEILDGDFIDQLLDVPYQGYGVWELNYYEQNGFLFPLPIERNYRDFSLKNGTLFYTADGFMQEVEANKTIAVFNRKKFNLPYGESLLKKLYFPVKFGSAGMDFWLKFVEKFGSPWAVGKTDGDKDVMADELFRMLSGDVAVLECGDEVELVNPSATLAQKELVEKADNYIREIILGGNLTGEVKGGSFAAAQVHNEVRDEIALGDRRIVYKALSQLAAAFKSVNNFTGDLELYLKDEDNPQKEFADRDLILYQMGYQRDQQEVEDFYNIKVTPTPVISDTRNDLRANKTQLILNKKAKYQNELDKAIQELDIDKDEAQIAAQIEAIFDNCATYKEAFEAIEKAYPKLSFDAIENSLERYLANSAILAAAEVSKEHKDEQ